MLVKAKTHNELSLSEDGEFPLERFADIKTKSRVLIGIHGDVPVLC